MIVTVILKIKEVEYTNKKTSAKIYNTKIYNKKYKNSTKNNTIYSIKYSVQYSIQYNNIQYEKLNIKQRNLKSARDLRFYLL